MPKYTHIHRHPDSEACTQMSCTHTFDSTKEIGGPPEKRAQHDSLNVVPVLQCLQSLLRVLGIQPDLAKSQVLAVVACDDQVHSLLPVLLQQSPVQTRAPTAVTHASTAMTHAPTAVTHAPTALTHTHQHP